MLSKCRGVKRLLCSREGECPHSLPGLPGASSWALGDTERAENPLRSQRALSTETGTLEPGSEGYSSGKSGDVVGESLGSESWWHSPDSSSSQVNVPSRLPQALWAQGRIQSSSLLQGAYTLPTS